MKEKTAVLLFAGAFAVALLFNLYDFDWTNFLITVGIFGGVAMFWFLYGKFHKGQ